MTNSPRTPQQRDRRFARVRRITRTVFLGSSAVSLALIGYFSSTYKPASGTTPTSTTPSTTPTTTATTPPTTVQGTPSTTPPTTAPVTTTTVCTTTPSGTVTCY